MSAGTLASRAAEEEAARRIALKNGHTQREADELARGVGREQPTVKPGGHVGGRQWTPPPTAEIPGFEEAAKQSAAAGGLEAQLRGDTAGAGEASAKVYEGAQKGIEAGAHGAEQAVDALAKPVEWTIELGNLLSPAGLLRIFKVLAGAVIVLVGIYLIARAIAPGAVPSASTIATAAGGAPVKAASIAGKVAGAGGAGKRTRRAYATARRKAEQSAGREDRANAAHAKRRAGGSKPKPQPKAQPRVKPRSSSTGKARVTVG